jgi:cephalosporin-C deacetylase-like acetyl esterase
MPSHTFYQLRLEKSGYEDILAVTRTGTGTDTLFRKLIKPEEIPSGMVYVEGYRNEVSGNFLKEKNGFFIDRYEVTNKQFKEFVDKGGYRKPEYWKNEFIKEGKNLTREEAMTYFTDKTGRLGPSTWEAEDYPDGYDDYPVTGVSWYEAAAYAEYARKNLPTSEHWSSGVGFYVPNVNFYNGPDKTPSGNLDDKSPLPSRIQWISYLGSKIVPLSNFNGKGPEPVGKFKGISCFGAYDMAGNVREWCWNKTTVGRIIRGGAWNDANYLFSYLSQLPSFDRSPKNGFRCVQYIEKEKIPESAFQQIKYIEERDFSKEEPVPENIFTIYKNQFLYDNTDLQSVIEARDNSHKDWTMEKITFNAAYGKERVIAYLFLPRNSSPPFQTLIYWHGLDALWERDLIKTYWQSDVDFLLKNGRAVMCPIYKGTFERIDKEEPVILEGHQFTEWVIKWVKDFRRSIDYLETRSDIDKSKLGFYGSSWGGMMGLSIPAVEDRLAVNILICGGTVAGPLPEVHAINYVSRIKIPTLMLNGRYDYIFPYDNTVLPLFNLLGTPGKDKRLCVYETDHHVPYSELIKEVLSWCDKYFGPVNHLP